MHQLRLLAAAILVIAVACSSNDSTPTPTASATAEVSPAATATPTSGASSTSTAEASATAAVPPMAAAGQQFGVVKVQRNDPDGGLNLRAEPAAIGSQVLAVIPHTATNVIATGQTIGIDDARWYEVTYEGTTGWVNAVFLTPLPSFDEVWCGDTGTEYTFGGGVPQGPSVIDHDADSVFSLHQYEGPDCQRTVITFGRDFNYDDALAGALQTAGGVPENVAVGFDLASVVVTLPETVIGATVTASESFRRDNGLADLLFVRPTGDPGFGVVALWDRNRGARVFALESPGRLVIDTIDAPTGGGLDLAPITADDLSAPTVLRRPINPDVFGPAPDLPITVSGWARPFEATVAIELRTRGPGASIGTGEPVNADWSGSTFAASCGSQYAVMTTDWMEAWGAFSFTIEALAPGSYELFVGEFSAEDGRPVGVYHRFTVGGSSAASC